MDQSVEKLIKNRAYELWQAAGEPSGRDEEFWLQAEHELVPSQEPNAIPPATQSTVLQAA